MSLSLSLLYAYIYIYNEYLGKYISNESNSKKLFEIFLAEKEINLLAGTAWLFSDPRLDEELDYLFIEEAGQVSLANMVNNVIIYIYIYNILVYNTSHSL